MSTFDILLWKENTYPKYLKKVLFLLKKWRSLTTDLQEQLLDDCKYIVTIPNNIQDDDDLNLLDLDSKLDKYLTEEELTELESSPTPSYQYYVEDAFLSKIRVTTMDMYKASYDKIQELHHR